MGNDCLKCAKWDNGKGLEVLYQLGISSVMTRLESLIRFSEDLDLIQPVILIINEMHEMDQAIVNFQTELGLIGDPLETAA